MLVLLRPSETSDLFRVSISDIKNKCIKKLLEFEKERKQKEDDDIVNYIKTYNNHWTTRIFRKKIKNKEEAKEKILYYYQKYDAIWDNEEYPKFNFFIKYFVPRLPVFPRPKSFNENEIFKLNKRIDPADNEYVYIESFLYNILYQQEVGDGKEQNRMDRKP